MHDIALITGRNAQQQQSHHYPDERTATTIYHSRPHKAWKTIAALSVIAAIYTSAVLYAAFYISHTSLQQDKAEISALLNAQRELAVTQKSLGQSQAALSSGIHEMSKQLSAIAGDQSSIQYRVSSMTNHFEALQSELQKARTNVKTLSRRLAHVNKRVEW